LKGRRKKMSSNKRFGSPIEGEKAKESRSELSQTSLSNTSTSTVDDSSVLGSVVPPKIHWRFHYLKPKYSFQSLKNRN
jgi:hypothetical protein